MKQILRLLTIIAFFGPSLSAQNLINLQIQHKIGEEAFSFDLATQNNLKHDLKFSRVEYYISEITIFHDGDQETKVENVWILVNAGQETLADLGTYDIEQVERVKFHIGVDKDHNHLDPSSYQNDHPLAPKFPSMHWGWAAGYRFIAVEGYGGSNYNQVFQLHGLGDTNYFDTEVELSATAEDGQIQISIQADYTRVLENIGVNGGIIVHGENAEAQTAIMNFRDYVFSAADISSAVIQMENELDFTVFPNPAPQGMTRVIVASGTDRVFQLDLTDLFGERIISGAKVQGGNEFILNGLKSGVYVLQLSENGKNIQHKKLIIQ